MAQASTEKLEQAGPVEKKGWPQCHKVISWEGHQKEKELNHLRRSPNR